VVGAVWVSRIRAVVDLVLWQGHDVDVRVYLAERDTAEAQAGPADEFCMEVRAAVYDAESVCGRALAVYGRWISAVGGLLGGAGACLCSYGEGGDAEETLWAEELPVCGVIFL
jgi:hypothetical protein